jgi:hypothetical protein
VWPGSLPQVLPGDTQKPSSHLLHFGGEELFSIRLLICGYVGIAYLFRYDSYEYLFTQVPLLLVFSNKYLLIFGLVQVLVLVIRI